MVASLVGVQAVHAAEFPVTAQQRSTARIVAQNGVPVAELAPNAPDSYTVKPRDTLWDISKLFLRSPWRWPELWGMNLEQIRNPHLIYPGQVLYLDKTDGRARLRLGQRVGGDGTTRLSPRVRSAGLADGALPSIPFHLIEPFLNEAIIFQGNELEAAPRIVATQEGRVILGRGDTAYVRGDLTAAQDYRIFREARPLKDPATGAVLGYEARFVGAAEYTRQGGTRIDAAGRSEIVPATFLITSVRVEAGIGDRLAVVPAREFTNYAPVDGVERGHVLALVRDGERTVDRTDPARPLIKLPDERNGLLFVFRVFDRMSYALILTAQTPVKPGDHFSQP